MTELTPEALEAAAPMLADKGAINMVNLLRYNAQADYPQATLVAEDGEPWHDVTISNIPASTCFGRSSPAANTRPRGSAPPRSARRLALHRNHSRQRIV